MLTRTALLALFEQADPALQAQWQAARTDTERSSCLTALARAYMDRDLTISLQLGEVALELALADSSPRAAVESLMNMGWASMNLNHHLRAAEQCAQAMHLIQEHDLRDLEAHALNIRALSRMMVGDELGAERDFKRALHCAQATENHANLQRTHVNSAWFFTTIGQPARSLHHLSLLEAELPRIADPKRRATIEALLHENRAHALLVQAEQARALGRQEAFEELLDASVACVLRCNEALQQQDSPYVRTLNQLHHARLCRLRGDLARAEALALEARRYTEEHDLGVNTDVHLCLAEVWVAREQWTQALAAYQQGLAIVTGQGRHRQAQQILQSMAQLHERRGDLAAALAVTRQALETAQLALTKLSGTESSPFDADFDTTTEAFHSWQERLLSAEFLARQDELTGLLNRRGLESGLQRLHETQAAQTEVLVAFFDLDHFKSVNDEFSHAVGDRVLRQCARLLKRAISPNALLSRYGGEEFVLVALLQGQAPAVLLEGCRQAIQNHSWQALLPGRPLTVSIGYACGPLDRVPELLQAADEHLYHAKRSGRNCISPASQG